MQIIDYQKTLRTFTDQGFLKVPGVLARTGIQVYYAFELGLDGDPMRRIRVYRPESEVFAPEAMASFEDSPITIDHPTEGVSASNWKQLTAGHVRNIRREGIYLMGDMIISDAGAIKALDSGKSEISNGYGNLLVMGHGFTPDGEEYDAKQTNIRGNHVALVDAARCGSACRVSDNQTTGASKMALKKTTIDGLPLEFDESAVVVIEKLVSDRDKIAGLLADANKLITSAVVDGKTLTTVELADQLVEANKVIADLKLQVMTPDARDALVESWAKMIADAKRIAPTVETKGKTCAAVRREVVLKLSADATKKATIDAVTGGVEADKATDAQISTAFAVLAASPVVADSKPANVTDPLANALVKDSKTEAAGGEKLDGRDLAMKRAQDAWKTPVAAA